MHVKFQIANDRYAAEGGFFFMNDDDFGDRPAAAGRSLELSAIDFFSAMRFNEVAKNGSSEREEASMSTSVRFVGQCDDYEFIIACSAQGTVGITGTFKGVPLNQTMNPAKKRSVAHMAVRREFFDESVAGLNLSVRTANVFEVSTPPIQCVGELIRLTESDLLDRRRFRNFGKRGLAEVKAALAKYDPPLTLGMDLTGIWPTPPS